MGARWPSKRTGFRWPKKFTYEYGAPPAPAPRSRFARRREAAREAARKLAARIDHLAKFPQLTSARYAQSKGEARRRLIAEAQRINPAIRTLRGAKKLDRRLTLAAKRAAPARTET